MSQSSYLTAGQAAQALGVKLPTLYAYVSRGLIRSEEMGNTKRERYYDAEDVQRLKERQQQRRDPTSVIASALDWGAPVLESALTLIRDGKLYYRGQDAVTLASQHSIEEVASLLWAGNLYTRDMNLNQPIPKAARAQLEKLISHAQPYSLIESFQIALLMAASEDPAAYDLRPDAVRQTGARILRLMTAVAASKVPEDDITQTLSQSWAPNRQPQVARLLNATLILLADHEFNVSSFTARCVASSGATPYAVVTAGLAALQGTKHGGAVSRVEALFGEIQKPANAQRVLTQRLRRGEDIPGFGHKLYPEGDPRARVLLGLMGNTIPRSPTLLLSKAVMQATRS